MSIQELSQKFKGLASGTEILLAILIVVVASISFYLGRLSVRESVPQVPIPQQASVIETKNEPSQVSTSIATTTVAPVVTATAHVYVASKSGTKYHLPTCSGAKQIKEENKIWFATKADAEKAGYTPAANCKGI